MNKAVERSWQKLYSFDPGCMTKTDIAGCLFHIDVSKHANVVEKYTNVSCEHFLIVSKSNTTESRHCFSYFIQNATTLFMLGYDEYLELFSVLIEGQKYYVYLEEIKSHIRIYDCYLYA